jgi:hypothetical protein
MSVRMAIPTENDNRSFFLSRHLLSVHNSSQRQRRKTIWGFIVARAKKIPEET